MTVNEEVSIAIRIYDGVSATAKQMGETVDQTKAQVDALDSAVKNANASIDSATTDLEKMTITSRDTSNLVSSDTGFINSRLNEVVSNAGDARNELQAITTEMEASVMAVQTKQALELSTLMGVKESVGSVIGGVTALGLVSQETAQDLAKVNAAFQLMAGAATGLKTLQVLMTSLNAQTAINASLNTFLSVVRNHALGMAAVGAGLGAMAGVAGMYLYTNNQSNKTVNITVDGGGSSAVAQEIYTVVNGGAL